MLLLDLRAKFEAYFEQVGRAWLDDKIANNAFPGITNKDGWLVEFDEEHITYAYYPDAWHSRNCSAVEAKIPIADSLPEYGDARALMVALTA